MPSPFAKTLIDIAIGHLLKPPVAWVSQNGCKFHVETSASAAANGQSWRALCGATGDCYFIHSAKAVQPAMRCSTCQELSTTGIQDSTQEATKEGEAEFSEAQVGMLHSRGSLISGVVTGAENVPKAKLSTESFPHTIQDVADQGRGTAPLTESITVGDTGGEEAGTSPLQHDGSTMTKLQKMVLDAEINAHIDRSLGGYRDPAEDQRFA